ncbi:NUDIX hydrolase [soil metagenome]
MRAWKPSVTVASVIHQDDRFLLVEEETSEGIRFNNPAGHLDPGESLVQAVIRETLEETAYRFVPQSLLGVYMSRYLSSRTGQDVTYLRFAFTGTVSGHDPMRPLDTGILRAVWMTLEEIKAISHLHRSPLVMRSIEDCLAGVRHPLDALHADPSVFLAGPGAH